MCGKHLERHRKYGTATEVPHYRGEPSWSNPNWRGNKAGYNAVHTRIRTLNGPASSHECADCGMPAQHWSYNHCCDEEAHSTEGPYCHHPEHYEPRCVPCHKLHDLRQVDDVRPVA